MEELEVRKVIISKQAEDSENYQRFKSIVQRKKIHIIKVKQGERVGRKVKDV